VAYVNQPWVFCASEDDHVVIITEVSWTKWLQGRRECGELHGIWKDITVAKGRRRGSWCMGLISLAAGWNVKLQENSAHSDYGMCLVVSVVYCRVSSCNVCYSENIFKSYSFWLVSYNLFWETNSVSPSQETSKYCMKTGCSLPCSQTTPLDPNPNQMNSLNTHFVIILSLRLGLPSGILPPVYQTYLILCSVDRASRYKSCKWPIWRPILFHICLFQFSTCFQQPRAHQQENQLYQYNIWYVSLCVGDRLVCRSGSSFLTCILDGQSDTYQMLYWYNWFSCWWARGCWKHV
jgi:hypothetical protein